MRPLWMSLLIAFVVVALAAFFFIRFDGWALVCNLLVDVISRIASIRYTSVNPLAFVALLGLVVWLLVDKAKTIANETIS